MPYKEGGKWRAKVTFRGRRYTSMAPTKRAARAWEEEKRKELRRTARTLTVSLLEASTEYLAYCERQYSRSTFTDKRKALKELMAAVGNIGIQDIRAGDILNGVIMVQKTPNLANKRRKDLHSFFEYLRKFYGLPINPMIYIDRLPQERRPQPVPTEEEFLRLLTAAGRHDRNLLITFACTGGRRSEIFRLTWTEDINFQERTVRLGNRKNRAREMKYRYVDMNDELFNALQDQWRTRLPHSDYVFQNRDEKSARYGQRYTTRRRFMAGLRKQAGIDKPIGFHALRRFFASMLADNRETLPTIQKLLGHAAISTTDRYIYHLKDDTRAAVAKITFKKAREEGTKKTEGLP